MWKTDLKNKKFKRGRGNLLNIARNVFSRFLRTDKMAIIMDEYGQVGYETDYWLLVAKKDTYGDIVSVNKGIWETCLRKRKKILMYLAKSGYLYEFDPATIKNIKTNFKGTTEMVNFSVREGKNLMKELKNLNQIGLAVKKNEEKLKELFFSGVLG